MDEKNPIVALVAPAGATNPKVIDCMRDFIHSQNIKTTLSDEYQNTEMAPYGYHAHGDDYRYRDFYRALESHSVVWCLRGGYGSQSIIRSLMQDKPENVSSNLVIGFSDCTLLGLWSIASGGSFLHGTMCYNKETQEASGLDTGSETSLGKITKILKGETTELSYSLRPFNEVARKTSLESSVLGGNLSVIQRNAFGLLKNIDWDSKILFLEDTSEDIKRAENILFGFFDSGLFDNVQGIFFGNFPLKGGGGIEVFMERFDRYLIERKMNIPLYYNPDFGHGIKNEPLPMGTKAIIKPMDHNAVKLWVSTQ